MTHVSSPAGRFKSLNPKSNPHLVSPYNYTTESFISNTYEKRKWSPNKESFDCSINSPYQHLRKCVNNSIENIHTDVANKFDACTRVGRTSNATSKSSGLSPPSASAFKLRVRSFRFPPVRSFPSKSAAVNSSPCSFWSAVGADWAGPTFSITWAITISAGKGKESIRTPCAK